MGPHAEDTAAEHPDSRLLTGLARLFDERVMGLLALIALATALGPMVFDVTHDVEVTLTVVEWVLVAMFAAEFVLHYLVAPDRRAWLGSPWRIVDALTVLGPVVALLPRVSDVTSGSLMLRMLRLGRAVAFGTRAGSAAVRTPHHAAHARRGATPVVSMVSPDAELRPVRSDWSTFLAWTRRPGDSWYHASNLDGDRFHELAHAAGLTAQEIARVLDEGQQAKLTDAANYATLVLQMPVVLADRFPETVQGACPRRCDK